MRPCIDRSRDHILHMQISVLIIVNCNVHCSPQLVAPYSGVLPGLIEFKLLSTATCTPINTPVRKNIYKKVEGAIIRVMKVFSVNA